MDARKGGQIPGGTATFRGLARTVIYLVTCDFTKIRLPKHQVFFCCFSNCNKIGAKLFCRDLFNRGPSYNKICEYSCVIIRKWVTLFCWTSLHDKQRYFLIRISYRVSQQELELWVVCHFLVSIVKAKNRSAFHPHPPRSRDIY